MLRSRPWSSLGSAALVAHWWWWWWPPGQLSQSCHHGHHQILTRPSFLALFGWSTIQKPPEKGTGPAEPLHNNVIKQQCPQAWIICQLFSSSPDWFLPCWALGQKSWTLCGRRGKKPNQYGQKWDYKRAKASKVKLDRQVKLHGHNPKFVSSEGQLPPWCLISCLSVCH